MTNQRFENPKRKLKGLTVRAVVIGLFFVVGICIITPYNNHYVGNTYLASNHLPIGPLFILTFLIFFNIFLKKLKSRLILSSSELTIIWCIMIVTASIPSKAFAEYLLPTLVGSYYFATPENEWQELFHQYLPDWLTPKNLVAARNFYEGAPDGNVPWEFWIKPLLLWMLFALLIYGAMFCLSTILRKQWVEHERITFPLVQLPAEIIREPESKSLFPEFFKNRLMWIAFAAAGMLHILNGLHFYFPIVPFIPTQFSLDPFLTEKPFSAIRPLPLHIHPSVIGITYLLALRVSLSIWFFYILYKFECLIFDVFGLRMPGSPGEFGFTRSFASHQEMGAFIVVIGMIIWNSRKHIKDIVQKAFSTDSDINEPKAFGVGEPCEHNEPMSHRWAILGLLFMLFSLVVLSQTMGMSLWVALSIILFSAMMWVIFTWQVASAGVLIVHPTFDPMMMLRTAFGDRMIGPRSLTIDTIQARGFRTDLTQLTMPHIMNTFKISDLPVPARQTGETTLKKHSLLLAILAAIMLALPISSYFFLKLAYKFGGNMLGLSWVGNIGFRVLDSRLIYPTDMNKIDFSFIFIGAAGTLLVAFMYHRLLWWPLHPIGCTTGSSWGIQMFLLSIFLGWLFKYIILKYGGLKAYRNTRPLFLGLILGEYVIGAIWIIVGLFVGRGYRILTA